MKLKFAVVGLVKTHLCPCRAVTLALPQQASTHGSVTDSHRDPHGDVHLANLHKHHPFALRLTLTSTPCTTHGPASMAEVFHTLPTSYQYPASAQLTLHT